MVTHGAEGNLKRSNDQVMLKDPPEILDTHQTPNRGARHPPEVLDIHHMC